MDSFFSHPFVWFFLGVFSYRLISKLLNYVHAIHVYNDALVSSLSIYRLADLKIRNINKTRYLYLEETKDLKRLKKEKQIDQQVLAMWRTVCIHSLINHMPKNMRRLAKFRDWDSAMKWLEALSGRVTVNKWGE
tara:strand:- start:259 stop:660 length:402 start_codon:yes stop_codon:yes gene_type:complete